MISNLPDRTKKALKLARTEKVKHVKYHSFENGDNYHEFEVRGNHQSIYEVRLYDDGSMWCECKDYEFNSGELYKAEGLMSTVRCKHCDSVMAWLAFEQDKINEDQEVLV